MPIDALLLINFAATWFLIGLIWIVQVVHYAQFDLVGEAGWAAYHRRHTRMITYVVAPPMLLELASSIGLLIWRPAAIDPIWLWVGLALLVLIWLSTAFIQVPAHDRLAKAFDAAACRRLVVSNWIRTIAWTARGAIVAGMVWRIIRA